MNSKTYLCCCSMGHDARTQDMRVPDLASKQTRQSRQGCLPCRTQPTFDLGTWGHHSGCPMDYYPVKHIYKTVLCFLPLAWIDFGPARRLRYKQEEERLFWFCNEIKCKLRIGTAFARHWPIQRKRRRFYAGNRLWIKQFQCFSEWKMVAKMRCRVLKV